MDRIPEPELMNDLQQAQAYAYADFAEPHNRFIDLFKACFPDMELGNRVLDLGCGPADISIRFARAYPEVQIDGMDGAENMLNLGKELIKKQHLDDRIHLYHGYLPADKPPGAQYDVVISNSLLHHLKDPMVLWHSINDYAAPQAAVFVMDLLRPDSMETAHALVNEYAINEPPVLQEDFFNSLCASYQTDEVAHQLTQAGLANLQIRIISDRHFIVYGMKQSVA